MRQIRFLEWAEAHLEPVAFTENNSYVGVALLDPAVRITVRNSGLTLSDGIGSEFGIAPLLEALPGVLEVFGPRSINLVQASLAWSAPLPDADYNPARSKFAARTSGFDTLVGGLTAIDASSLMDLESSEYSAQAEWGIVSASELVDRLVQPDVGRIAANRPGLRLKGLEASELPSASLFIDTSFHRLLREVPSTVEGIKNAMFNVDSISEEIAQALLATELGMEKK
ncbi:MAG: hypothetical protein ACOH14_07700 [Rhodoglobus sp.]